MTPNSQGNINMYRISTAWITIKCKQHKLTMSAGGSKVDETPDVVLTADTAESPDIFKRPSELSPRSSTSTVGTSPTSKTGREIDRLSIYKQITDFCHSTCAETDWTADTCSNQQPPSQLTHHIICCVGHTRNCYLRNKNTPAMAQSMQLDLHVSCPSVAKIKRTNY